MKKIFLIFITIIVGAVSIASDSNATIKKLSSIQNSFENWTSFTDAALNTKIIEAYEQLESLGEIKSFSANEHTQLLQLKTLIDSISQAKTWWVNWVWNKKARNIRSLQSKINSITDRFKKIRVENDRLYPILWHEFVTRHPYRTTACLIAIGGAAAYYNCSPDTQAAIAQATLDNLNYWLQKTWAGTRWAAQQGQAGISELVKRLRTPTPTSFTEHAQAAAEQFVSTTREAIVQGAQEGSSTLPANEALNRLASSPFE